MAELKRGDKAVFLGGLLGKDSPNRGKLLEILEGPLVIEGWAGKRYIVDLPLSRVGEIVPSIYHVNEDHLLKLT